MVPCEGNSSLLAMEMQFGGEMGKAVAMDAARKEALKLPDEVLDAPEPGNVDRSQGLASLPGTDDEVLPGYDEVKPITGEWSQTGGEAVEMPADDEDGDEQLAAK